MSKTNVNHGGLQEVSRRVSFTGGKRGRIAGRRYEILWDRFKSKYGGHRTWVIVRTGENKRVHSWITLREIMRVMEVEYEKEKAEVKITKTDTK